MATDSCHSQLAIPWAYPPLLALEPDITLNLCTGDICTTLVAILRAHSLHLEDQVDLSPELRSAQLAIPQKSPPSLNLTSSNYTLLVAIVKALLSHLEHKVDHTLKLRIPWLAIS